MRIATDLAKRENRTHPDGDFISFIFVQARSKDGAVPLNSGSEVVPPCYFSGATV